ncbi:hypothetical protein QWJ34_08060 [Saccharibacillus sp. CPCC 101409]|uniref:DUF7687 domain-containing protein n=1 Tax=Saccharibacillus sp. CPCC 101409 TaxID=3058041 RepID=UPI0026713861|nr:hypothetical protein [Saccharibacillus sp. CPCC 101409]MDO3409716.1 hypothetical protein [Saccharibacillus sp. CPCC 101409]
MKPNAKFLNQPLPFWGIVRLLSEQMGYSKKGEVIYFSKSLIRSKLNELYLFVDEETIHLVQEYIEYRAMTLNNVVKKQLLDVEVARSGFYTLKKKFYDEYNFTCSLPYNKQKEEKKDYAYFTGMINILTELAMRKYSHKHGLNYGKDDDISFNDDPRNLTYVVDGNNRLITTFSRRFDGAFPSTRNPSAIWEIKEYYYTTTFGSRIADGVFETQLDGFEITELEDYGHYVKHVYLIDAYNTWWNMGKSYLCRIIDMLHRGQVSEVIFGKEIFERWEEFITELLVQHFADPTEDRPAEVVIDET